MQNSEIETEMNLGKARKVVCSKRSDCQGNPLQESERNKEQLKDNEFNCNWAIN